MILVNKNLSILATIVAFFISSCSEVSIDSSSSNGVSGVGEYEKNPIDTSLIKRVSLTLPAPPTPPTDFTGTSKGLIYPSPDTASAFITQAPNLIYISRTAQETNVPGVVAANDVVIWNGYDAFLTNGATDINANGLYIGRIDEGSSDVVLVAYVPPVREANIGHKYSANATEKTYAPKIIGASKNTDGSITLAYQRANRIYLASITDAIISATAPAELTPFKTDVLDSDYAGAASVGKDYEPISLYSSGLLTNCPGGGDVATDGSAYMVLTFARGYQLSPDASKPVAEQRNMGQPFSKYIAYDSLTAANVPVDGSGLKFEEKKNLNANRSCFDTVSYNPFSSSFGIINFSTTDRLRFSELNFTKNTQSKSMLQVGKNYSNTLTKLLVGLNPVPVGQTSPAGPTTNAFALLLNQIDQKLLARSNRKNPALTFSLINKGNVYGSRFVFDKDLTESIMAPKSAILSTPLQSYITVVLNNRIMELDFYGNILKGPSVFEGKAINMAPGDKMFHFTHDASPYGMVGFVVYEKSSPTNTIDVYRYDPFKLSSP